MDSARSRQYSELGGSISARSNNSNMDSARTWRTEDLNTARVESMMKDLTMERKNLQQRLRMVQEEIDNEYGGPGEEVKQKKKREPVIKNRLPIFIKQKRKTKFLLKKYSA
ncbi:hypothetical protein ScalyP_jg12184 [Parmales sp. scaly parma]|mgnify:CR=1 FL=1|nr:hypothetical protein ScalyP_jg12184 [Parmales sp. scaly parma]|tara:strand:+ start:230 stop:562 length:333 start_codon:yes stop_codon:yes gene_type:complete